VDDINGRNSPSLWTVIFAKKAAVFVTQEDVGVFRVIASSPTQAVRAVLDHRVEITQAPGNFPQGMTVFLCLDELNIVTIEVNNFIAGLMNISTGEEGKEYGQGLST